MFGKPSAEMLAPSFASASLGRSGSAGTSAAGTFRNLSTPMSCSGSTATTSSGMASPPIVAVATCTSSTKWFAVAIWPCGEMQKPVAVNRSFGVAAGVGTRAAGGAIYAGSGGAWLGKKLDAIFR
jgi:hypothetical protein